MVNIIPRDSWEAEVPVDKEPIEEFPVSTVLVMYTKTDTCTTMDHCLKAMYELQERHMDIGLPDIQWNFLIGGDGQIYEGRSWETRPTTEVQFYQCSNKSIVVASIAQPSCFLIGGDGQIYEGRGWETRPTTEVQFYQYSNKSIDVAFIGNPEEEGHITKEMEQALLQLVREGVNRNFIKEHHDVIREQVHKGFQG